MRILFLDHPQFTSGSYFLWHGLNEVLGSEAVVLYPYIPTHYDADRFDVREQPWFQEMDAAVTKGELPEGIPKFAPGEGLTGGGQFEIRHYEQGRKFASPNEPPSEGKILLELEEGRFDLVILSNSHRVSTIALGRLKQRVKTLPPIVYYDAGERDELNEHWVHVFRPQLVFKQILTPEVEARGLSVQIPGYMLRMLPLPLSSPIADNPTGRIGPAFSEIYQKLDGIDSKIFDIFFWLGSTWPGRAPTLSALEEFCRNRKIEWVGCMGNALYHVVLAISKIALTMRGSGRDTQRYWEIPLYRTLMLSDGTMGCLHPYAFEDGKTASFYNSIDELLGKIDFFLKEKKAADRIASAGKEHLRKYHTTGSRAVFFLERVSEYLGVTDEKTRAIIGRWKEAKAWDERSWKSPAVGGNL